MVATPAAIALPQRIWETPARTIDSIAVALLEALWPLIAKPPIVKLTPDVGDPAALAQIRAAAAAVSLPVVGMGGQLR